MNNHTYLRAYLAGVFLPTLAFPALLTVLFLGQLTQPTPFPVERIVVFPLTFVPACWGLWNMLWVASRHRTHLPLGLHGAILFLLLLPAGATLAKALGVITLGPHSVTWFHAIEAPYAVIACGVAFALVLYYLAWKYIVGFVNRVLGVA
ncbi:MAG: hypothetical protein ABR957_03940 [Terracidiphilus sp.]|jgi:hypothetical protein